MTKLTQKKVKFEWGDKQEAAFPVIEARSCVVQPILLTRKEVEDIYRIICDASKEGFGRCLMQREKVFSYVSRQLKIHKKNYTTHDWNLERNALRTGKVWNLVRMEPYASMQELVTLLWRFTDCNHARPQIEVFIHPGSEKMYQE
ncbi:putative reverse transcriptase domain-containing protein [Tanacetum coccineum]